MYGNLSEEGLIELGEVVSQGDIIGQVGKTSLFEFDSPEHLHFEIRLGDEYKDPSEYIKRSVAIARQTMIGTNIPAKEKTGMRLTIQSALSSGFLSCFGYGKSYVIYIFSS